jgi:hypothetical protein
MTFYSGQNGRLIIDDVTAAKVTNWSISTSMSPLATTTLEDTDQTFIDGLRTTTGSCRLFYYDDTSSSPRSNSAKTLIENLIKTRNAGTTGQATPSAPLIFKLQVVEGTNTTREIKVEALLTSASMAMGVGEVLAADVSFQCNGAALAVSL